MADRLAPDLALGSLHRGRRSRKNSASSARSLRLSSYRSQQTIQQQKQQNRHTELYKHPLEGDHGQTIVQFLHYLWKKDGDLNSCRGVLVPETVVYEHSFPNSWYGYDAKHDELRIRTGKDLDTQHIMRAFCRDRAESSLDIIATYMSISGKSTHLEYLNKDGLDQFLHKRSKRSHGNGFLQKFVVPKGSHNFMLQAVWSPHVCLVERLMNNNKLLSLNQSMFSRAVTFEGPSHYSSEVFVAPSMERKIRGACQKIVNHFEKIHIRVQRMVLFFKADTANNVWFTYASSVRIAGKQSPNKKVSSPVNLNTAFHTEDSTEKLFEPPTVLIAEKYKQKESDGDVMLEYDKNFECPNCGKRNGTKLRVSLGRIIQYHSMLKNANKSPTGRDSSAFRDSSVDERIISTPRRNFSVLGDASIFSGGQLSPHIFITSDSARRSTLEHDDDIDNDDRSSNEEMDGLDFERKTDENGGTVSAETEDKAVTKQAPMKLSPAEILEDALDFLDDIIYQAYSHFMHSSTPYTFPLSDTVKQAFEEELDDVLRGIGVWPSRDNPELYDIQHGPVVARMQRNFENLKSRMMKRMSQLQSSGPSISSQWSASRASAARVLATIERQSKMKLRDKFEGRLTMFSSTRELLPHQHHHNPQQVPESPTTMNVNDSNVPDVLKNIVPGLTNGSFKVLSQESLFMTRKIEVCEKCFLLFTESSAKVSRKVRRRARSAHASLYRVRSSTPKSPPFRSSSSSILPKIHFPHLTDHSPQMTPKTANRRTTLRNREQRSFSAAIPKRSMRKAPRTPIRKTTAAHFSQSRPSSSGVHPF